MRWRYTKSTILLLVALSLTSVSPARACITMPSELVREHDELIAEAREIALVEVLGSKPATAVAGAKQPAAYIVKVVAILRGQPRETFTIVGEGDLSGIWDTTFSDHSESEFWTGRSGRMGVQGSCELVPPLFVKGKRYLVLLGGQPDTKQYERIDSDQDLWLEYVRSRTYRSIGL